MPPEETVSKIKSILNGAGLHLVEQPVQGNSFFSAATLTVINPVNQQILFRTFGKGVSSEWASASAWGEMIERIQNLAFYMMLIYPSQTEYLELDNPGFIFFPDEKVFSLNTNSDPSFLRNFSELTGLKATEVENFHDVIGVPFLNIFNKTMEYFPFRAMHIMVGSNGMCSGNTMEEALIQGISELFERVVLKTLYLTPLCPPDIPISYFKGTEIESKIARLSDEFDYTIRIKDCSLGKGYPVIGVLIRNNQNGYVFQLGADPSPITALERCFTEMFQGGTICFQSLDELVENLPYDLDADFWKKNLRLTITASAGQWPSEIVSDISDYEFNGFDHPHSVSDVDDLTYLLQLVKRENREIFIRDNSFLGHPAYYIYIPGMSEMTNLIHNDFFTVYLAFDNYLPILTNLKKSSINQRKEMVRILQRYIEVSPMKEFDAGEYFHFYQSHPIAKLQVDQLMTLIRFSALQGKLPNCFHCTDCLHKEQCNFPFLESFWNKIKDVMDSTTIDQTSLLHVANA